MEYNRFEAPAQPATGDLKEGRPPAGRRPSMTPARLERATSRLGILRSILMSYGAAARPKI